MGTESTISWGMWSLFQSFWLFLTLFSQITPHSQEMRREDGCLYPEITKQCWGIILSPHQDSNEEGSFVKPKWAPWKFSRTLFYTLFYPRKWKGSLQRMGNGSLFFLFCFVFRSPVRNHPKWRNQWRDEGSLSCPGSSESSSIRVSSSIIHPDGNDVKPKPGIGRGDRPVLGVESLGWWYLSKICLQTLCSTFPFHPFASPARLCVVLIRENN